jgi:hypothetical protein
MPEKNTQVGRMGEIYSKASFTVVWLAQRGYDSELLEKYVDRLLSTPRRIEDPGGVRMLDQRALAEVIRTSFEDENNYAQIRRRRHLVERFLGLSWFY